MTPNILYIILRRVTSQGLISCCHRCLLFLNMLPPRKVAVASPARHGLTTTNISITIITAKHKPRRERVRGQYRRQSVTSRWPGTREFLRPQIVTTTEKKVRRPVGSAQKRRRFKLNLGKHWTNYVTYWFQALPLSHKVNLRHVLYI